MALSGVDNSYWELLRLNQLNGNKPAENGNTETAEKNIGIGNIQGSEETKSYEDIESDYAQAAAAVESKETNSTTQTSQTSSTTAASGATSDEIKEEIEELEKEKEENIEKMEKIEEQIEDLAKEAETNIMNAAKAQETAVKDHEEETQEALDENIQAYINANKEGGEGMTRDELQENIKNSLPNTPEIADAVAALTAASEQVNEIDSCLGELNKLISDTQLIENEIADKQEQYEAAVEAEEAAKCCDPIGFTTTDANGNQAQYDFIVDDGSFDSTSDFLGANGQWDEMTALDADGDNVVSAEELQNGNIKAVKTNADGSQEIVDLAEEFGEDFSIDLSSYSKGGSHSAIDTTADSDGDGVANQSLLGTFNLNINGETVNGYNTLDDSDWLSENYGISSDSANETQNIEYSEDLQPHVNFFNMYTDKSEELKSEIEAGYEDIGISQEQMDSLNQTTQKEADEKAKNFFASLGVNSDETKTEQTTNTTETSTLTDEEEKEELEKELLAA